MTSFGNFILINDAFSCKGKFLLQGILPVAIRFHAHMKPITHFQDMVCQELTDEGTDT